jgi:hypothetical protein
VRRIAATVLLATLAWLRDRPHADERARRAPRARAPLVALPFAVGERGEYDVRFGVLRVGHGTMEIVSIDTVRGRAAYHAVMTVAGGIPFFRVDDRYDSWFDTATLNTLRSRQQVHEGRYHRDQSYEIDGGARRFVTRGDTLPSVADPLDETAMLYVTRTMPLAPTTVYRMPRYFVADQNPIELRVLRRERVEVPAGAFDAIVVRPVIRTPGMFSDGGNAQVWFADDGTRRLLRLRASLSFGSLALDLRAWHAGGHAAADSTAPP